jgi:hypothetical protein
VDRNRWKSQGARSVPVGGVWQHLPMHLFQRSCCQSGGVRMRVVVGETDSFDWSTSSFGTKGWLYSVFKKLRIIIYVGGWLFYQKFDELDALIVPKNAGHIFPWRRCNLRMFPTSVRPSLNDLPQSHTWVLESVSSPNCALRVLRIAADFTFLYCRRYHYWQEAGRHAVIRCNGYRCPLPNY